MSYSDHRDANVKDFNKSKALAYDSSWVKNILILCCHWILRHDSKLPLINLPYNDKQDTVNDVLKSSILTNIPISRTFNDKSCLKILDFACGTGLLAELMTPYLMPNSEFIGIDISENQIDLFNSKIDKILQLNSTLKIHSYQFDIVDENFNNLNNLSKPDSLVYGSFDFILCTLSFHHLSGISKILSELQKYLNDGGKLIILDFYDGEDDPDYNGGDDHHGHGHEHEHGHGHGHGEVSSVHHRGQSPQALKELMEPFKFTNVESDIIFTFDHWLSMKQLSHHIPPSKIKNVIDTAKMRHFNKVDEYLVNRNMVMTVCEK
ncbi:hypothetical protein CANARDRAFT_25252 [[Candida] arabinofermentans NRRL YB-2248]|uniref:Methyltransferase domain-containing protein n=1 Tax=[Candida] arabinofermentans NRRL YB-2248 TaxID=983967 RepID=A0A1E4SUD5_9ASCO|nr:hypothetical protein CANARDRAFT_25252 [[Candida] arabinofermentans NRRL YB-2248]